MRQHLVQSGLWREWRALYGAPSVVIRVVLTSIRFDCRGIGTTGTQSTLNLEEVAQQLS